jgi:hypothetical protein
MMDQRLTGTEGKSAEQLCAEKRQRVDDVIALKEPDRVPFYFSSRFWAARQAGMTCEEAMYDAKGLSAATKPMILEFQPDLYQIPHTQVAVGPQLEALGFNAVQWPGHGVDPDVSFQYIDQEFMSADEYDDYLFDPTGFFLRKYLPRIADGLQPLAKLPDIPAYYHTRIVAGGRYFADPEVRQALATLGQVGDVQEEASAEANRFIAEMESLGFPLFNISAASAPYDQVADYMRGSKGAMLDMFRHKDKLLAVLEKATHYMIDSAIALARGEKGGHVFMPLHWGLDGFMSPDQFETFYWPYLRRIILACIEADLVPYVFWEGHCESRLETIADIPAGKAIYKFEHTDLRQAKAVLGDVVCIQGNVPASLINTGTPQDVDDYCRNLIRDVKKGGGFILDGAASVPDEAKFDNVAAMAEAVHKYGVYG